jgi:DNA-binding FadR family transcriptional regulator
VNVIQSPVAPRRLKQPRIAEIVADGLRQRILSGELKDSDILPKQEDLMAEFGVSPPCIREAFRILETEGLVTVLRGNVGGAVVHVPQPLTAAYMMGLVLESRRTSLYDLLTAMRILEPACAATCAERADRHTTVLPLLRKVLDDGIAAIDDPNAFIGLARQFHTVLVANCGNETMSLVVGSLEVLWSAQVDILARNASQHGSFAERGVRQSLADEHERIYRLIAEGDARGAEQAIREHYSAHAGERRHGFDIEAPISAARLKA